MLKKFSSIAIPMKNQNNQKLNGTRITKVENIENGMVITIMWSIGMMMGKNLEILKNQ